MGRTFTPTYRIEMQGSTAACWRTKDYGQMRGHGQPTAANLTAYVNAFVNSQMAGGPNEHIREALGKPIVPTWARIVRQSDNRVMAMFYRDNNG